MNILITNDDGCRAEGLACLSKIMSKYGKVYIAAPESDQSSISRAVTTGKKLLCSEIEYKYAIKAYKVYGTPADCINVGVLNLFKEIDLIVSGINIGANIGSEVFYSGTVSAAAEGRAYGIKSFAISMNAYKKTFSGFKTNIHSYQNALLAIGVTMNLFNEITVPENTILNVNIPCNKANGIIATGLEKITYTDRYTLKLDSDKNLRFRTGGIRNNISNNRNDLYYVNNDYIVVSPVSFNINNYDLVEKINNTIDNIL